MATGIKTWQIINGKLEVIETSLVEEGKTESYDLESWIVSKPAIIGLNLFIIGRQVLTKSGPLDLLAIDKDGNLIVIELKRDKLPREALAQAIDYASNVAEWDAEKINSVCIKHTKQNLEDIFNKEFSDVNLESININETQRIILVGFSMEAALERMVTWLSDNYNVNVNVILLNYIKTQSGEELLNRTSIISEVVEQERIRKKKFQIPMSDEPGEYNDTKLKKLLQKYLSQSLYSSKRIRNVLLPACLEKGALTRDELKKEFVNSGEAESVRDAGYFLSLVSQQIGMEKNDFLRQVIGYDYPNYPWEKDNYKIKGEYKELVQEVLNELNNK